jgi:uncharacterized protein DUF4926
VKGKFKLFDSVVADRDILEPDLMGAWGLGKPGLVHGKPGVLKGTHGAIVEIFDASGGLAVEFFDAEGETIDVAFIPEDYVTLATETELAPEGRRKVLNDEIEPE